MGDPLQPPDRFHPAHGGFFDFPICPSDLRGGRSRSRDEFVLKQHRRKDEVEGIRYPLHTLILIDLAKKTTKGPSSADGIADIWIVIC